MTLIYIFVWTFTVLVVAAGAIACGTVALATAWVFVRELARLIWGAVKEFLK